MVDIELLRLVGALYKLGNPEFVGVVSEGLGSANSVIVDGQTMYFVKQYVQRRTRERVREIQAVEQFLVQQGLPAVAAMETSAGDCSFAYQGRVVALFPFVTGKQFTGPPSIRAVASAGAMLARLHRAGAGHGSVLTKRYDSLNKRRFTQLAETLRRRIDATVPHTSYDDLARDFVDFKLRLVRDGPIALASGYLDDDHLLHGDYHHGNLLFDQDDRVQHVVDFERVVCGPRSADVALGLFYLCFDMTSKVPPAAEADNLALAEAFLHAYQGLYPMAPEELERGIRWFILTNQIYMLWPVTAHYLGQDASADALLRTRFERCQYLVNNVDRLLPTLKAFVD